MPRSKGRTGRPWRRVRAQVLAISDVCWICGKPGANTVDHVVPISIAPALALEPSNLRPACGSCNSSRGNGTRTPGKRAKNPTSRDW